MFQRESKKMKKSSSLGMASPQSTTMSPFVVMELSDALVNCFSLKFYQQTKPMCSIPKALMKKKKKQPFSPHKEEEEKKHLHTTRNKKKKKLHTPKGEEAKHHTHNKEEL